MSFLSVIIPTYNSEATIERCLNSLAGQTYQDFEICIIDGASSDETIAKVNKFYTQFKHIRILSEPDKGVYDAMNKGVDISKGEWLYFLGSDDEISDDKLFSDIFKTAFQKDCGIIYGNVRITGNTSWAKDGQIYDGEFDMKQLLAKNVCHQAIFYRKILFDKLGKYNTRYPAYADWELNLRFFPRTKFEYLDRTIANFYVGGISSQFVIDPIREDISILRKKALAEYYLYRFVPFLNLI
jgi:glycosyltransferase involved in cell wall biosynthesis